MAGSLFSRLNSSFGSVPSRPERVAASQEKVNRISRSFPLQLLSVADIAPRMSEKHVVIIGAGFAGLTAAWWLSSHGFRVTVLEARKRVGGRVSTHPEDGHRRVLECGGELIGRNHPNWIRLARHFGLGLSHIASDDDYRIARLHNPMWIRGQPIDEAEQAKLYNEMTEALKTLDPLAAPLNAYTPWIGKDAEKLDGMSVAGWIDGLTNVSDRTREAIRFQIESDQTAPVEKQSLLGLLAAVKGGSMTDLSKTRTTPSEFWTETEVYRCAEGNQQLAESLRSEIERLGGSVRLSTPVTEVSLDSKSVNVITAKRESIVGNWVVVAIPLACWDTIKFPFALDQYRVQIGQAVKYLADTRTRFWVKAKLSPNGADDRFGMIWEGTDNQRTTAPTGAELTVFAGGPLAGAALNSADAREYFHSGLERVYRGFDRQVTTTRYVNWPSKLWTQGGYSCPDRGQVTVGAQNLYNPVGRLVWAGEHTCMAFFGYMEAALQSGMHSARLVAQGERIYEVQKIVEDTPVPAS
jgi:monoamine oxidase